jgi:hypothetical protein
MTIADLLKLLTYLPADDMNKIVVIRDGAYDALFPIEDISLETGVLVLHETPSLKEAVDYDGKPRPLV